MIQQIIQKVKLEFVTFSQKALKTKKVSFFYAEL